MADAQIGNALGIAAVGLGGTTKLADITAEGTNTFTVSVADAREIDVGMTVVFVTAATGVVVGTRNVTAVNGATGVVTYDSTDLATTTAEDVYLAPYVALTEAYKSNLNGGVNDQNGFELDATDTIGAMRARLKVIAATTYTDNELNKMTYNDMVYAIRLADAPASIKQ